MVIDDVRRSLRGQSRQKRRVARLASPPRLSSPCPELCATFHPLLEALVERGVPVVLGCPQQGPGQGDQGAGEYLAVDQTGGAIVVGRKDEGVLAVEQLLHAERAGPTQLLARRRDGDRGPEPEEPPGRRRGSVVVECFRWSGCCDVQMRASASRPVCPRGGGVDGTRVVIGYCGSG